MTGTASTVGSHREEPEEMEEELSSFNHMERSLVMVQSNPMEQMVEKPILPTPTLLGDLVTKNAVMMEPVVVEPVVGSISKMLQHCLLR